MDYSKPDNWLRYADKDERIHDADMFYLYPTCVSPKCRTLVSEVDDFMKLAAEYEYIKSAATMAAYTNVYAPFHRQIKVANFDGKRKEPLEKVCYDNEPREDVYAALDWFFENCNEGRPYILAGHSQGSCNLKYVLAEYMLVHPDYYERMVACYAIGHNFRPEWFEANPHVKRACGETDCGVLISWNAEGTGAQLPNNCAGKSSLCINPLNWRTDDTAAGLELNKGSMLVDDVLHIEHVVPGIADATINLERGTLMCSTRDNFIPTNPVFGDKSLHFDEWSLYYDNIGDNARKRIEAFMMK